MRPIDCVLTRWVEVGWSRESSWTCPRVAHQTPVDQEKASIQREGEEKEKCPSLSASPRKEIRLAMHPMTGNCRGFMPSVLLAT